MSFHVMPGERNYPCYREVLELTNTSLNAFLYSMGVQKKYSLSVELRTIGTHKSIKCKGNDTLIMNDEHYAWFTLADIIGGVDCYFVENLPIDNEVWEHEIITNKRARDNSEIIKNYLSIGYCWIVRRSAGQPGIVALAYGLLAASLAKLTNGLLYSDDGAWDYAMFPATSDDFLQWYFRPERSLNNNVKLFTAQCLLSIMDLK